MTSPPSQRRSRLRLLFLAGFLTGSAVIAFILWHSPEGPNDRIRRELLEALPVGSTREQAEGWADRMGIRHEARKFDPAAVPAEDDEEKFFPRVAGLTRDEAKLYLEMLVPWGSYRVWLSGETAPNQ